MTAARTLSALLVVVLASGCHGKFRRVAESLGSVRPIVTVAGRPSVSVAPGWSSTTPENEKVAAVEAAVELGTGIATAREQAQVSKKLLKAVDSDELTQAAIVGFNRGVDASVLPFEVREDGRHPLRITITDYGFVVSDGQPAVASEIDLELTHKREKERVYRAHRTCVTPLQSLDTSVDVAGIGDLLAMQYLSDLKPAQLDALLTDHVRACARQAAEAMARHAD